MSVTAVGNRRVASLAVARVGSRAVSSIALGMSLLLIARGTSVADFGHFMTAYTVGLIVGLAVGFGAPTRILRAGVEKTTLAGTLFSTHTVAVTIAVVVGLTALAGVGVATVTVAGVLFAVGDTVQNYAQAHLTARDRQVLANIVVVSHRLIPLVAVICSLALTARVDFAVLAAVYLIPIAIGVLAPMSDVSIGATRAWREALRGSGGYWVYSLAAVIPQLQIPLLALVVVPQLVGEYSLATRVIGPITLLTASLSAVLVPELARRLDDVIAFRTLYRFSTRLSGVYLLIVMVAAWPGALAVVALAGPKYRDAAVLVFAMIVAAGIAAFGQAANSVLLAVGGAGLSAVAIVAGATVGLGLLVVSGVWLNGDWLWVAPVVTQIITLVMLVGFAGSREPSTARHRRKALV
ncbi:lipopolysaccharide biosynthesis protein [Williamsia sp. SKLECPSW1]